MKNPFRLPVLLSILALLSACGKPAPSNAPATAPDSEAAANGESVRSDSRIPQDLPPCPDLVAVETVRGDARTGSATLFSRRPPAAVVDFYAAQLAADGWILGASIEQGKARHLQFHCSGRFLRFQIDPSDGPGAARVLMAWNLAAVPAESSDADIPEPDAEESAASVEKSVEW
ncbi:MAG: hypothetical protein AB7V14_11055 [Kiritimatiellia bacterium]